MKLSIDYIGGTKGIIFQTENYSIVLWFALFGRFQINKAWRKIYGKKLFDKWYDMIFSIYKNRRKAITEWDIDITVLGFTLQINKYKDFYKSIKTN